MGHSLSSYTKQAKNLASMFLNKMFWFSTHVTRVRSCIFSFIVQQKSFCVFPFIVSPICVHCRDDSFKVACDWTRAKFSPDASYVAVGSHDGTLFIWNTQTAKLEKKLKEMR